MTSTHPQPSPSNGHGVGHLPVGSPTPSAPIAPSIPALHIQNLRFAYRAGFAISVRDFQLQPAEQAVLTGSSGCGKSTLLHLIAGLIDTDAGAIRIAGADMTGTPRHRRDLLRAGRIGMIFQTFNLLTGFTALQNVMAAMMFSTTIAPREHHSRASDLLSSLGIQRVNADVGELSIGQQQRVAVARALACRPALVLADEPTASLDPENSAAAIDLIQTACRDNGAALLCVTHDPAVATRFARRFNISDLA